MGKNVVKVASMIRSTLGGKFLSRMESVKSSTKSSRDFCLIDEAWEMGEKLYSLGWKVFPLQVAYSLDHPDSFIPLARTSPDTLKVWERSDNASITFSKYNEKCTLLYDAQIWK